MYVYKHQSFNILSLSSVPRVPQEPGLSHLRDGAEQLHQFSPTSQQLCAHTTGWAIFHNSPVPRGLSCSEGPKTTTVLKVGPPQCWKHKTQKKMQSSKCDRASGADTEPEWSPVFCVAVALRGTWSRAWSRSSAWCPTTPTKEYSIHWNHREQEVWPWSHP